MGLLVAHTAGSGYDGDIDEIAFFNGTITEDCADWLYNGGSPTSTQQYDFSGPPAPFGNFTVDAQDLWNSSSIIVFNATIDGIDYESNATGQISTNFSVNDTSLHTIKLWTNDYFNRTYNNYNASLSGHLTGELYQAVLCLNASEKVSGNYTTVDSFTIDGVTQTCYNISAGDHNVQAQKTGWYDRNQTITVTALSNATQTIVNLSYANLTIYAVDGTTNESLSNYDLIINSLAHPSFGESASGVTNHSFYLINGTFNVSIDVPGYAVTTSLANISVNGHTNYTFYLYKSNSVTITIRDEISNALITENITVRWSSNSTTWENSTDTGTLFVYNITPGSYQLLFYSSNYSTRTYGITVGADSTQFLTAYMISSAYSTIFTMKDIDTGAILSNVSIAMSKLINSTWTTVESKLSDISGKAQFFYDPIATYRFYLSRNGYEDYVFYLNPILFSTYDVLLSRSDLLNYTVDYDDISIIWSPHSFTNEQNTTLNFLISSPGGQLTTYSITATYPGGSSSASGVNAIGEQLSIWVNVTGATRWDTVRLDYNYTSTLSGLRTFTQYLPIVTNVTASDNTFMKNKDETYGLGIFERVLIVTLIIIFIVGIASMVGQPLPGIAIGLFVYGILVFSGFIPIWVILPSMTIGILFLVWKSGGL